MYEVASLDARSSESDSFGLLKRAGRIAHLLATLGIYRGSKILYDRVRSPRSEQRHILETARLRHPLEITASHGDIGMFTSVVMEEEYRLSPSLKRMVHARPIIDLGANIGISAAYFGTQYPDSRIIAVEPHPRNINLLQRNCGDYNVTILQGAVSDAPGRIQLQNPEASKKGLHGSYRFTRHEVQRHESIEAIAITPEELLEAADPVGGRIGLIKTNIEGAEKDLFSCPNVDALLQHTNILMVEAHDQYVAGCTFAIQEATKRNGMSLLTQRGTLGIYLSDSA